MTNDDDADMPLVCLNVEDGDASVPSFRDRCGTCRGEVWRSNRSRGWVGRVLCVRCVVRETGGGFEATPAPWVAADLRDRLP